jgi:hypothetical protein
MRRLALISLLTAFSACNRSSNELSLKVVGAFASDPTAIAVPGPHHGVELAIVGNTGGIWRSSCAKDCQKQENFGGFKRDAGSPPVGLASAPVVLSWNEHRIDLFVLGGDKAIWHQTFDNSYWLGWETFGGTFVSAPAVSAWPQRFDVFAIDESGVFEHRYCDALGTPACRGGNWSRWEVLDRPDVGMTGDPSAISASNGHFDLVVLGKNGSIYHRYWDAGWSPWKSLGGKLKTSPAITTTSAGQVQIFASDSSGALWSTSGTATRFRSLTKAGVEVHGRPAAYAVNANDIQLFSRDAQGATLIQTQCDARGRCKRED